MAAGAAAVGWAIAVLAAGMAAPAAAQSSLQLEAAINGRPLAEVDANSPLELDPDQEAAFDIDITNTGDEPIRVRSVRLIGRALGLTFFNFSTQVGMEIAPGETAQRRYALDIADLGDQARGLLPAELVVVDEDRQQVASRAFPVDVDGSFLSTYGVFGLLVAAATILLLVAALGRLATRTLHPNRWYRAVRFGVVGAGLALTATFTLSVTRVLVPDADRWVWLVVGATLVGLVFGFLTPGPTEAERAERREETIDVREPRPVDEAAVARTSASRPG